MLVSLVVIGGGGCGREVLDVVDSLNVDSARYGVVGVVDDGSPDGALLADFDVAHLGPVRHLEELHRDVQFVVGIGAPGPRAKVAAMGGVRRSPVLVHPTAAVSRRQVVMAPGVVICSQASIQNHVTIGKHVHVNQNCTIGHDVTIGDYSVISPLVAISGNAILGRGVFLGAGASILPGVTLGDGAVVGAGAAVTSDVAAGETVVGVPARPVTRQKSTIPDGRVEGPG